MFIMHVALQGCLRARNVPYGVTPDTGGHIKYLLELVDAAERQSPSLEQQIIVRRFVNDKLGAHYAEREEQISARSSIIRINGASDEYVAKEDLRFELPVLADHLEAHIRTLPRQPDVLHGHYADGGELAVEMKRRLGIPVVFTAHSLGHVKARTLGSDGLFGTLRDRIDMEERVIAAADRIITSSMDEAELQYGFYSSVRPERVRVNPPGCDLERFRSCCDGSRICREAHNQFLIDPDKRPILALARPVHKKNLAGLVRAFGEDLRLQDAANLIIYAGTREKIAEEDTEPREVLTELLTLIDDYDLWGKVAFPKTHREEDVAGIYRDAAERRGVFANVALNEPFGLTFLEAAASGLPVVATNSGGSNDILARCHNGVLVDPINTHAIGEAILGLLSDNDVWDRAARNGLSACDFYSWDRHATEYLAELAPFVAPQETVRLSRSQRRFDTMLVCDIDNTLTGDRAALHRLETWLRSHSDTAFGIATGRSLHSAIDIIRQWDIPTPQFLITSVGSEIYWIQDNAFREIERESGWPPLGRGAWDPDGIETTLERFDWLEPQPKQEQRSFKRSYYLYEIDRCRDVRKALEEAGLEFELIYSHGRFLDLLPGGVSKGHAIHHVANRLSISPSDIWAAGDSGNDIHMLEMVGKPIIVGNHSSELAHLKSHQASYFAKNHFAAGVLEGLAHDWTRGMS
ncbi:HAD-IIB family hydrolase [Rhodophyticola sp.]|jgi:sucrose-phosphate synthase|uniref:HAD-IIB family hydrolase n=1 Tax=Rhodophyticola sp. TaxID=2680032 RepID=UPI003D26CFC4